LKDRTKSYLAILIGIVIAAVDIIWIWQSYYLWYWVAEGLVILAADLIWIYLDYSLMGKGK
jgi:hypothetical protein